MRALVTGSAGHLGEALVRTLQYARRGWTMFPRIGRVYDNARARRELGWKPVHDFASVLVRLAAGEDWPSPLARAVGSKGYG